MNGKMKIILIKLYIDLSYKDKELLTESKLLQLEKEALFIINISEGLSFIDITNKLISDAINNRKKGGDPCLKKNKAIKKI